MRKSYATLTVSRWQTAVSMGRANRKEGCVARTKQWMEASQAGQVALKNGTCNLQVVSKQRYYRRVIRRSGTEYHRQRPGRAVAQSNGCTPTLLQNAMTPSNPYNGACDHQWFVECASPERNCCQAWQDIARIWAR